MPLFEIESNGKTYEVEAPDQAAAIAALGGAGPQKVFSGAILPFSKDSTGKVSFDSDAGIVGAVKRAVTLPRDVISGAQQLPSRDGAIPGSITPYEPGATQAIERVTGLASIGSPINPAARAGDAVVPGVAKVLQRAEVPVPSAEAIKSSAKEGYKAARDMGVDFSAPAVKNVAEGIQRSLEGDGIIAELTPKTFTILRKLQEAPDGSFVTLGNIDAARRSLGHAAADFTNKTEQLAAKRAMERLDEFVSSPPPEAVLAGPASAAGELIAKSRGNYAAAARSEKVTGAAERAELNAAVANSGQNLDNATRQRIRDILVRPKEARGYSPEELAQMEVVARGTAAGNTARAVGNVLGGGGGLGATVTGGIGAATGAAFAGMPGAAAGAALPPIIGALSKKGANWLTSRQVNKLDEMVRKRSPLYEDMAANAPGVAPMAERRAAIIRALLLEQQQQ